ncbi:MAG: sulfatase-like hydrolase/transferase, partial [Thermogutta sp.]
MCAGELLRTWLFVLVAALHFPLSSFGSAYPPSLNVIVIMTDNQGAWSLGCYGNPDIKTPHIDRLANEGVLFTRCFANNA